MAEWEMVLPKLKAAYQAWHDSKGRSIDTWLELCADRMDFRSLAAGQHGVPWTRTRTSQEEVRAYLSELTASFTMEHYTVTRFVCEDDTIVMIGTTAWRNIKTGKRAETPKVDVWRFRNGKAISFFEFYDTATVANAAREG
jgi:hypothetical protein